MFNERLSPQKMEYGTSQATKYSKLVVKKQRNGKLSLRQSHPHFRLSSLISLNFAHNEFKTKHRVFKKCLHNKHLYIYRKNMVYNLSPGTAMK